MPTLRSFGYLIYLSVELSGLGILVDLEVCKSLASMLEH